MDFNLNYFFDQFRGLNGNDPGSWPIIPRVFALSMVFAVTLFVGYYLFALDKNIQLQSLRNEEQKMRQEFEDKYSKAVNLVALKKQKELVNQYVVTIERQLPSKAEIDALLSDINQAGVGRGLQFDLFRPGQVAIKEYYAELPIDIKVRGSYHDIASFASDLSNLPRIVTLNDLDLQPMKGNDSGLLELSAVVKTYRYLDPDEVVASKAVTAKKK